MDSYSVEYSVSIDGYNEGVKEAFSVYREFPMSMPIAKCVESLREEFDNSGVEPLQALNCKRKELQKEIENLETKLTILEDYWGKVSEFLNSHGITATNPPFFPPNYNLPMCHKICMESVDDEE
jgi:hypothetical protein